MGSHEYVTNLRIRMYMHSCTKQNKQKSCPLLFSLLLKFLVADTALCRPTHPDEAERNAQIRVIAIQLEPPASKGVHHP